MQKMMIGLEAEGGEVEWEEEEEGDVKGNERTRDKDEKHKRLRKSDGGARKMAAGNG